MDEGPDEGHEQGGLKGGGQIAAGEGTAEHDDAYDVAEGHQGGHGQVDAERDAGEHIELVYLAQTGGHLDGFYNEGAVNVKAADNMIDADDIRTVCELARSKELPEGRMKLLPPGGAAVRDLLRHESEGQGLGQVGAGNQ